MRSPTSLTTHRETSGFRHTRARTPISSPGRSSRARRCGAPGRPGPRRRQPRRPTFTFTTSDIVALRGWSRPFPRTPCVMILGLKLWYVVYWMYSIERKRTRACASQRAASRKPATPNPGLVHEARPTCRSMYRVHGHPLHKFVVLTKRIRFNAFVYSIQHPSTHGTRAELLTHARVSGCSKTHTNA